jgi:hypothetical protein
MLKNILPIGLVGSWACPLKDSLMARQPGRRRSDVGHGAGEPIELRHHERVAGPDRRERW